MTVWPCDNGTALRPTRLVLGWATVCGYTTRYATSHPNQLSLLTSAGREMSTREWVGAVFCGWECNRTSGVSQAMRYRQPISMHDPRSQSPQKGR